jgi:hypothetical protein
MVEIILDMSDILDICMEKYDMRQGWFVDKADEVVVDEDYIKIELRN